MQTHYYEGLEENKTEIDVQEDDFSIRADLDMLRKDCDCKEKHHDCHDKVFCEHIEGNVVDVEVRKDDCEVRADVKVDRIKTIRLWGQVKDCSGKPIKCALVKLIKKVYTCGKAEYHGIAHTVTDCMGFYQFDICPPKAKEQFKIIVSKPATGKERSIDKEICKPCKDGCTCADK